MSKEIFEQPKSILSSIEKNDILIKKLVEKIRHSDINHVIISARGTSDHAAIYAKYLIEINLGLPVTLAAPSVFTMYEKTLKLNNSLVIGISQSGQAEDVLSVLLEANKQNLITVSITNNENSKLANNSKYHLYCNVGEEKSVAATKTFTSQIGLIVLLVASWANDVKLIESIYNLPEGIEKTLSYTYENKNKFERYRFMNECFVLARGINYSIALESALKLQETNYVKAKAYATSDFYHGPYAMIDKDMPVLIFAPKGPSFKNTMEMLNKLKESKAEPIIITNDQKLLTKNPSSYKIPETSNDIISAFYNVVVAQSFACELSQIKGLNPDNPRSLSKVTITK
jgi:glucosamine--fructose-6-phosphate aminotransferase (isomerizing)